MAPFPKSDRLGNSSDCRRDVGCHQRAISGDGRRVILFSNDGIVRFVDTATGGVIRKQHPKPGQIFPKLVMTANQSLIGLARTR